MFSGNRLLPRDRPTLALQPLGHAVRGQLQAGASEVPQTKVAGDGVQPRGGGFRQGRCPPQASFLLGATSSGFCAPGGQGHPSFSPGPGAMPAHSKQILTHDAAMQKAVFPGLRCLGCRSLGCVQGHGCRAERRPLHGHSPCYITCSAGVRSTYSRSSWNLPETGIWDFGGNFSMALGNTPGLL